MAPTDLTDSKAVTLKLIKGSKNEEAKVVRIEKKAAIDRTPLRNTPYTRYNWFKKLPVYPPDVPCVRISSKYEGSSEEVQRRTDLLNKSKWMTEKTFKTTGGKKALNIQEQSFIPNFVTRTPSKPAMIHQHRDIDKTKFLGGKDFKL